LLARFVATHPSTSAGYAGFGDSILPGGGRARALSPGSARRLDHGVDFRFAGAVGVLAAASRDLKQMKKTMARPIAGYAHRMLGRTGRLANDRHRSGGGSTAVRGEPRG